MPNIIEFQQGECLSKPLMEGHLWYIQLHEHTHEHLIDPKNKI